MASGTRLPAPLRRAAFWALVCAFGPAPVWAEPPASPAPAWPAAIEDNSFLIEEAYNQSPRVVQHISNFQYFGGAAQSRDYSFTQEWPVGGETHQLSYTLPYSWTRGARGWGDILLNYRYQLLTHDAWAAVAPRVSLILATGPGEGGRPGVQIGLPASKRLNAWLVVHANAGATLLPARAGHAYYVGASVVGLVHPKLNVLVELISTFTVLSVDGAPDEDRNETILNPGLRYALNLGSLQIVPGVAVPIRLAGEHRGAGVFAYLSFEHPF
jgi:hypothetical protein